MKNLIFRYLNFHQIIIINLFFLIAILACISAISVGSYDLTLKQYFEGNLSDLDIIIFKNIRIPRVLLAGFVGASLSITGACLQGLFRNPLADPGLIGVSAGAALGATISIVIGSEIFSSDSFGSYIIPFFAILGSALVIIILFVITNGFKNSAITYMLLAGIAINSLAGVGIGILTYISDDTELRSLTFWTMGSFGGVRWTLILPAIVLMFIIMLWTFRFARKLDLIQLGEIEAYRLGVNIKKLKFNIIISSAIMVGLGVSLSGMIGFVGLVVPHIVRLIGGVNHNYLLPASALFGAFLMIVADMISRVIIQPAELPVGLITSAIGAPFFLWLIFKIRKS
tara:strand:- start:1184 stop:2206 length:1023 start_codon:yes stop_codon:yes gene_type:complete